MPNGIHKKVLIKTSQHIYEYSDRLFIRNNNFPNSSIHIFERSIHSLIDWVNENNNNAMEAWSCLYFYGILRWYGNIIGINRFINISLQIYLNGAQKLFYQ